MSDIRVFGFIPIPHAYVYENIRGINKGERIDVGINDPSSVNVLRSVITTVPGFVQITKTDLAEVQEVTSHEILGIAKRSGTPSLASRHPGTGE